MAFEKLKAVYLPAITVNDSPGKVYIRDNFLQNYP